MEPKTNQPHISCADGYFLKRLIPLCLTLLYLISIVFLSYHHEVWRDEMRALNIVKESHSIIDLFKNLHNEGHPGLWHTVLYIGHNLLQNTLVLKIASIFIAIIAISIFLFFSPFSLIQKAIFIFGYFPLFEYSVISRNYGISMLFLFCFCMLYPFRFKNIIFLSLILFLLAQTHVYSLIIVISFFISFLVEIIIRRKTFYFKDEYKNRFLIGFFIIIIGIFLSLLQIYPDKTSIVVPAFPAISFIFESMFLSIILPGVYFKYALGLNDVLLTSVAVWLIYIFLLRKPFILMFIFISVVGLGMFIGLVYKAYMRHQGFLFLLAIVAFWLDEVEKNETGIESYFINQLTLYMSTTKNYFITLLLLLQLFPGIIYTINEIKTDYSSSKKLGDLINRDPILKQAIIIGEPDFKMEALPYYVKNKIYLPRENRFGTKTNFTLENKPTITLDEILNIAERIKLKYHNPIIIVIGYELNIKGPYKIMYTRGNRKGQECFSYNDESLERIHKNTIKIASFQNATMSDENYDVFLLK